MKISVEERFFKHVAKTSTCWRWLPTWKKQVKGVFILQTTPKRVTLAHRFAWELAHGAIPHELHVFHGCDHPACVNPDHLFLAYPLAKLTPQEVTTIRELYETGTYSLTQLGKLFRVRVGTIHAVIHRKTWKSVRNNATDFHDSSRLTVT